MGTALSIFALGAFYSPNESIKDWAYVQAKERMRKAGQMPSYEPIHSEPGATPKSYQSGIDHS